VARGAMMQGERQGMGIETQWGRIAPDGTVYVKTRDGERVVGSWQAGSLEDGLAHFVRRYEDLATEVGLLETRFASGTASPSTTLVAAKRLRESLPTANVVGDLDALDSRLSQLIDAAAAKREEEREARRLAAHQATEAKRALVEQAEELAQSTQWKKAGDRLREIADQWREIKGADRKAEAELWKRFAAARSEFNRRRGEYFSRLEQERKDIIARKEKLIAEAESLAQSSDWTTAGNRFRTLMTEWKNAGHVNRDTESALWQRFRAAQETFYSRRAEALAQRDEEQRANQAAREALLAEAETVDVNGDPDALQTKLRDLQRRWAQIGRAPRDVSADLDKRFDTLVTRIRNAIDEQRRAAAVSSSPLVIRLRESVAKLERKIDRARQAGRTAEVDQLEAQLATQREWLARTLHH